MRSVSGERTRAISLSRCPGTTVEAFFWPFGPTHVTVFLSFVLLSPAFSFSANSSLAKALAKKFIWHGACRAMAPGAAVRPCCWEKGTSSAGAKRRVASICI